MSNNQFLEKQLNGENKILYFLLKDHLSEKCNEIVEEYKKDHDKLTCLGTQMDGLIKKVDKLENKFDNAKLASTIVSAIVAFFTAVFTTIGTVFAAIWNQR